jgi:hypothetical protein
MVYGSPDSRRLPWPSPLPLPCGQDALLRSDQDALLSIIVDATLLSCPDAVTRAPLGEEAAS